MRSFVDWVSSRPYRLILATIASVYLLAPVAAALLVVDALRRGPRAVLASALISILGVALIGGLAGAGPADSLSLTAPILVGGAISGALLSWSRSLSLAFQGTIGASILCVLFVFAVVPEARQIGAMLQSELQALFELGGATTDQVEQFASIDPTAFVWLILVSMLVTLLAALMLGHWWYGLIDARARFGAEFRALKLGRTTGIALIVLVVAYLVLDWELIQFVAPMAVVGFLFQGLAVLHARSHSENWPKAVVILVYCLFIPWTELALMGVSAVGLLDNFFELRARSAPEE